MSGYSSRLEPVIELSCDVMECEICCLDRVFVCGDVFDCDENLRRMMLLSTICFIAFFTVLSGSCMYISRVRGNAYRKKFARVVLKKEIEQEHQRSMVGISMGIPIDPLAPVWHYESVSEEEEVKNPLIGSIQASEEQDDDNLGLPIKMHDQEVVVHDLRGKDFAVNYETNHQARSGKHSRKTHSDSTVDRLASNLKLPHTEKTQRRQGQLLPAQKENHEGEVSAFDVSPGQHRHHSKRRHSRRRHRHHDHGGDGEERKGSRHHKSSEDTKGEDGDGHRHRHHHGGRRHHRSKEPHSNEESKEGTEERKKRHDSKRRHSRHRSRHHREHRHHGEHHPHHQSIGLSPATSSRQGSTPPVDGGNSNSRNIFIESKSTTSVPQASFRSGQTGNTGNTGQTGSRRLLDSNRTGQTNNTGSILRNSRAKGHSSSARQSNSGTRDDNSEEVEGSIVENNKVGIGMPIKETERRGASKPRKSIAFEEEVDKGSPEERKAPAHRERRRSSRRDSRRDGDGAQDNHEHRHGSRRHSRRDGSEGEDKGRRHSRRDSRRRSRRDRDDKKFEEGQQKIQESVEKASRVVQSETKLGSSHKIDRIAEIKKETENARGKAAMKQQEYGQGMNETMASQVSKAHKTEQVLRKATEESVVGEESD